MSPVRRGRAPRRPAWVMPVVITGVALSLLASGSFFVFGLVMLSQRFADAENGSPQEGTKPRGPHGGVGEIVSLEEVAEYVYEPETRRLTVYFYDMQQRPKPGRFHSMALIDQPPPREDRDRVPDLVVPIRAVPLESDPEGTSSRYEAQLGPDQIASGLGNLSGAQHVKWARRVPTDGQIPNAAASGVAL